MIELLRPQRCVELQGQGDVWVIACNPVAQCLMAGSRRAARRVGGDSASGKVQGLSKAKGSQLAN